MKIYLTRIILALMLAMPIIGISTNVNATPVDEVDSIEP
jgi:hypothetical protein